MAEIIVKDENLDTQDISQEEMVEISINDLEAILTNAGTDEPINIAELLETEMVKARTLYLNGAVESETIDWMVQIIHKWNREDMLLAEYERSPIVLQIDTEGGDAYSATKLISCIENSVTPIVGVVEGGMCMSAGVYIFASCHHRILSRFSNFMYHQLSANSDMRTLREMHVSTAHFETMQNNLDSMLVENTGVPKEVLEDVRNRNVDWFISYEELVKYNFADEYI